MKSNTETRKKHIPERTCVACRQVMPKRELVRIVKTADGTITVDETGKLAGRGAYLCKQKKCWEAGLSGNRLEQVLRGRLTKEDHARLEEYKERL
ncbi:MAG: YlxR family protein [Dehalococcoidia bacterium]|nr:YlxR family protein [Dehalococcoidia bacterium]